MTTADRANIVITTLLQTICQAVEQDQALRAVLTEILREEFSDVARTAGNEIRHEDE